MRLKKNSSRIPKAGIEATIPLPSIQLVLLRQWLPGALDV